MQTTPKISCREYGRRRQTLMALLETNSIAILPSASLVPRNSNVDYPFRQNSDFYYLTGFTEPESVLVLVPGRAQGESLLFCQERNPEVERWHGQITGPEEASALLGIDDAFPIDDIDDILPGLIEGRSKLYYAMGAQPEFDAQVISWVNSLGNHKQSEAKPPGEFVQLDQHLHELRLFKSKQEIQILKRAAAITAAAHRRLMGYLKPGVYEYQLEAELMHEFMMEGARSAAYPSIVGAGDNACILHYSQNSARIKQGDLVLVDAGCEYHHYAADVTRTLPASGKFSSAQKAIYQIVLAAQQAAIDMIRPGNHWDQPHAAAVETITQGLIALGLLEGEPAMLIETGAYRQFYMHRTGHWLGLDVHDVGEYKLDDKWRIFEPGMVMTIEPGIYISQNLTHIPARYWGIGIRIEDDVLVTAAGHEVLTDGIPRSITDIEQSMIQAIT